MKKNWLELAVNEKSNNPNYITPAGNIGTDGIRLHHDPAQPAQECRFYNAVMEVLSAARGQNQCEFTLTRAALVTACKQALAIGKGHTSKDDYIPTLVCSVNGSFQYRAESNQWGSISGEWSTMEFETSRKTDYPVVSSFRLHKGGLKFSKCRVIYAHTGRDVQFGINPRFLLDALSGMEGETVTLRTPARNAPVYLTDGTREAVIMPIVI